MRFLNILFVFRMMSSTYLDSLEIQKRMVPMLFRNVPVRSLLDLVNGKTEDDRKFLFKVLSGTKKVNIPKKSRPRKSHDPKKVMTLVELLWTIKISRHYLNYRNMIWWIYRNVRKEELSPSQAFSDKNSRSHKTRISTE